MLSCFFRVISKKRKKSCFFKSEKTKNTYSRTLVWLSAWVRYPIETEHYRMIYNTCIIFITNDDVIGLPWLNGLNDERREFWLDKNRVHRLHRRTASSWNEYVCNIIRVYYIYVQRVWIQSITIRCIFPHHKPGTLSIRQQTITRQFNQWRPKIQRWHHIDVIVRCTWTDKEHIRLIRWLIPVITVEEEEQEQQQVNSAFYPSGVGKSSTGLYGWG